MFNDPTHPDIAALAAHHDAGTHDQIPAEQAAAAVQSFHENADPALVQQAAAQMQDKIRSAGDASPEAAQLAQIDPASATPQQVSAMHRFLSTNHPELARDALIAGGAIAVGALAAFAARRYLSHHGR